MSSKILYDIRDNSIMRSQPEPKGSAGLPSFEGLCKSARIPEDDKQYMDTVVINRDILTNQAKEQFRIIKTMQEVEEEYQAEETIDGETVTVTKTRIVEKLLPKAILKPKLEIATDKQQVSLSVDSTFVITVNITETIADDSFTSVSMMINDVSFNIDITDNTGSKTIELADTDEYTIACNDDRFRSQSVEVVAIE